MKYLFDFTDLVCHRDKKTLQKFQWLNTNNEESNCFVLHLVLRTQEGMTIFTLQNRGF